jgi:predicted metal-dependent hydrolase
MSAAGSERHVVTWARERLEFTLRRSDRRTLGITVRPDLSVLVAAPRSPNVEAVLERVRKRARWIRKQQRFFSEFLPQVPPRRYVSGETHQYLGRQYRLKVIQSEACGVKLKGRFIWVHTQNRNDAAQVRRLVQRWYLMRAEERLTRSFDEGVRRLGKRLDIVPQMRLRRMPKRWGSWTRRGLIWLNPELVKAPTACIDYVVAHELCHLVHGHHGRAFYDLLRRLMPDWEMRKARLETVMAASGCGLC